MRITGTVQALRERLETRYVDFVTYAERDEDIEDEAFEYAFPDSGWTLYGTELEGDGLE